MLSFNFLAVYLNQIFLALQKKKKILSCVRFKADAAFPGHLFCTDLSFLSPCKSSAFGFCCRNPLGIATVMLLICLPFFGLHCLLTKECSFCCFGRVFSFLADVFSITQCVFFCLPAFIASSSSEDYTLGFI